MNDHMLLLASLFLACILLTALAVRTPSTFLLDTLRRLFSHGHPLDR